MAEAPETHAGRRVTLVAEVDRVFGDRAFEVEGDDPVFDEEVGVVTRSPVQLRGERLGDGDEVVLTGTVRTLVVTEVERELGWDLDPELEVRWEKKPVLIADSIRLVEESARWSEAGTERQAAKPEQQAVRYSDFVEEPSEHVGAKVDGEAKVAEVISDRAFWIEDDSGKRTLAVLREEGPRAEQRLTVERGKQLRFAGARAMAPGDADQLPGELDESATRALGDEPAFLSMSWREIEVVE